MPTSAKIGHGAVVRIGDGGWPEVFSAIGEVIDIPEIKKSKPPVDATSHDSTNKEYIYGLANIEALTIQVAYSHSTEQALVITDHDAGNLRNFEIQIPLATPRTATLGDCVIADYAITTPTEDKMVMSFTLQPATIAWA